MTANTGVTYKKVNREFLNLNVYQPTAAAVLSKISSQEALMSVDVTNKSSLTQTKSDELNLNEKSSGSQGKSSGSQGSGKNIMVKQCKLKRTRFVNNNFLPSKSAIGGGINFRESHVPNQVKTSRISKTLMSRIKNNSLSDIESINSQEEETSKSQVVNQSFEKESDDSSEARRYSVADLNSQAFGRASLTQSNINLTSYVQLQASNIKSQAKKSMAAALAATSCLSLISESQEDNQSLVRMKLKSDIEQKQQSSIISATLTQVVEEDSNDQNSSTNPYNISNPVKVVDNSRLSRDYNDGKIFELNLSQNQYQQPQQNSNSLLETVSIKIPIELPKNQVMKPKIKEQKSSMKESSGVQSTLKSFAEQSQKSQQIPFQESCLFQHQKDYQKSLKIMKFQDENYDEMLSIIGYLQQNKIKCFKYNNQIDQVSQYNNYQSYLQLGTDCETLNITKLLPEYEKIYTESKDPDEIKQMIKDYSQKRINQKNRRLLRNDQESRPNPKLQSIDSIDFNLPTDIDEEHDEVKFKETKSKATCKVSEIKSILYGGQSSRFWMLRKHINMMDDKQLKEIPFYSWNCVTLCLLTKDIDLVIKDEYDLKKFLQFLVFKLKTIDGTRDSAVNMIEVLNREQKYERMKQFNRTSKVATIEEHKMNQGTMHLVNKKVMFKYTLMKARNKISFMAFQKNKAIGEFLIEQVLSTYNSLVQEGSILNDNYKYQRNQEIFSACLRGEKGLLGKMYLIGVKNERLPIKEIRNRLREPEQIETLKVVKNGKYVDIEMDKSKNQALINQIQNNIRKDQCLDIFQNVVIDKQQEVLQQKTDAGQTIKYKFKKKSGVAVFNQLNMILRMKLLSGTHYCLGVLKKYEIVKKLMVLELERGSEIMIPQQLSQDSYAMSFRYYDPIFKFINNEISPEKREYFDIRNNLVRNQLKSGFDTLIHQIFCNDSLSVKQICINEKERKNINHHESQYTKEIQRSKYIQIDLNAQKVFSPIKTPQIKENIGRLDKTGFAVKTGKVENSINFNVQYMKTSEVNRKRQKELQMKSKFLSKIQHLKQIGDSNELCQKVESWLKQQDSEFLIGRKRSKSENIESKERLRQLSINNLMHQAEKLLQGKTKVRRSKRIERLKTQTNIKRGYQQREFYVEGKIEQIYKTYDMSKKAQIALQNFKSRMNVIQVRAASVEAASNLSRSLMIFPDKRLELLQNSLKTNKSKIQLKGGTRGKSIQINKIFNKLEMISEAGESEGGEEK